MKIIICGGHHNSALVVAELLLKKGYRVFWIGHKYTMIGDKNPSAEYKEVTQKNIPFFAIKAGKFQPRFRFLQNLIRIPLGFFQSFFYLLKIKPDLIVSFGGYIALPVAISGFILRIPVVTHEQTTVSGLANQIISRLAKKVFVSFESSLKYLPPKKSVLTGLPLRNNLFCGEKIFNNQRRTIYITGGKQGSHIINEVVFDILPTLIKKFNIIHQCGSTSLYNDLQKASKIKSSLGKFGQFYLVKEYFFDSEIGSVYKTADMVVSRAGAHTVYELAVLNKPAILIPLPYSSKDEQFKNAEWLANLNLAKILPQERLKEKDLLLNEILDLDRNLDKYKIKKPVKFTKAEEKIVEEIEKILKTKGD